MINKFIKLNDLSAYKKSHNLSNLIWKNVVNWNHLAKNTIGQQFIRAIDSISANIAEGFGRGHKKDKVKFYFNARASVYESLDWLQKTYSRKLITQVEYQKILLELKKLPKEINSLIKFTRERMKD